MIEKFTADDLEVLEDDGTTEFVRYEDFKALHNREIWEKSVFSIQQWPSVGFGIEVGRWFVSFYFLMFSFTIGDEAVGGDDD